MAQSLIFRALVSMKPRHDVVVKSQVNIHAQRHTVIFYDVSCLSCFLESRLTVVFHTMDKSLRIGYDPVVTCSIHSERGVKSASHIGQHNTHMCST